ncbi:MAG TPA: response regulator [Gemmatimonadales bacterium]|nr:response regulator [Gemmatimonadales bacterium]
MHPHGRILIADDEDTFLRATTDLLRGQGYEVDAVADGAAALDRVKQASYDLLISDLEMPGNEDLALIREVAGLAGGLPVIIITGFPSTASAIASIDLPVAAYLLKPVSFAQLLARIEAAVSRCRAYQAMRRAEERLARWRHEFSHIAALEDVRDAARGTPTLDAFLALTLRNMMGSLMDLQILGQALAGREPGAHPCQLGNCPRGAQLQTALNEAIAVLEQTKASFRSKTLGTLRRKLELLRDHA